MTKTDDTVDPSDKERFQLLYERLKLLNSGAIDAVFKATAAFLIVTGWIVTSDGARTQLKGDSISRWIGVAGLALYAMLFSIAAYRTAKSSRNLAKHIDELAYMPRSYYADIVISMPYTLVYISANLILSIAVATFILRLAG